MKICIGTDHAGMDVKDELKAYLEAKGHQVKDFGAYEKVSCDYTDYALTVAEAVANGEYERGILVCSTGVGMSIAANKVKGIRAALVRDKETAELTRQHNDSNILVISGKFTPVKDAEEIADVWLNTAFSGDERHIRRISKITKYEEKQL